MYYLWSLLCSITLFIILQWNEYNKNPRDYKMLTISNIGLLCLIYILITIVFYFIFDNENVDYEIDKDNVDNTMLKQIKESVYTGFDPIKIN